MKYEEKRNKIIGRLKKINVEYQTGGRLVDGGYYVKTNVGSELSDNLEKIADEIMSLFGLNKPTREN